MHTDYIVLLFIHIVKFFASYVMVYTLSYHHTYKQDTNLRLYSVIQTSYPRLRPVYNYTFSVHNMQDVFRLYFLLPLFFCKRGYSVAFSKCLQVGFQFFLNAYLCIFFCIFSFLGLHIIHSSCILDKKRIFIQEDL